MNFSDLAAWVPAGSCRGVLLDLGVSSHQLNRPERGFSFQQDGPLDMRMDDRGGRTAADVVNEWPADELARAFWELGDERDSRRIARAIETERKVRQFTTTGQLAACVERVCPRGGRRAHPATRVFQALRIVVNDELGALRRGLAAAMTILEPRGRLAVLTFHSLEDRIVRDFMREESRDYDFDGEVDLPDFRRPRAPRATRVTRRAILPDDAELADNPRARSAQLRVLEKN
jgi:16S rRNA (cytosine1402-N4)-methyltransferase